MAIKDNSKQIEDLALKRIGRGPNGNGGDETRVLTPHTNLQAQALGGLEGEQVIHNLKARFLGVKVQGRDIGEETEFQAGLIPQKLAGAKEMGGADVERHFVAEDARLFHRLRVKVPQLLKSRIGFKVGGQ